MQGMRYKDVTDINRFQSLDNTRINKNKKTNLF